MIKVGVKYCGNCNPQIDCVLLLKYLQDHLRGKYIFAPWNEEDSQLLLIISGCPVDCATRPDFSGDLISVAGYYLDNYLYDEKSLLPGLIQRINEKTQA